MHAQCHSFPGIEIHDAVNEIMNVSYQNLHKLGGCLGLDESKVQNMLTQYRSVEKYQRLIEMWFRKSEPTWEQLHRALSSINVLGESSTSMETDREAIPRPSSTGNRNTISVSSNILL